MSLITEDSSVGLEPKRTFLDKISNIAILWVIFLLPIFFIPAVSFPFSVGKNVFLALAVLLVGCFWLVARLKDGRVDVPKSFILGAGALLVAATFLSALFSDAVKVSFFGQSFELGTFGNLFVLFLLLFLTSIYFKTRHQISYAYGAFFLSLVVVSIFQIIRLVFGPETLSFGVLNGNAANLVGKWNDLAIFFGLGTVLSLGALEFMQGSKMFRYFMYGVLAVSLFFCALVNFKLVLFVVGFFSLVFSVYALSFSKFAKKEIELDTNQKEISPVKRHFPAISLAVILIALVFIVGGDKVGGFLARSFSIATLEARPPWSTTMAIAGSTLKSDPIFGAGPSRFVREWLMNKPAWVNNSVFWNSDFAFGVGFVPSFLVTTGLLGALAWLLFLGAFLYAGVRAILSPSLDGAGRSLVSSSFLATLFLWIFSVFYIPSTVIVALTFAFTGIFIATLVSEKLTGEFGYSFADRPERSFISVLIMVLLLIGVLSAGYFVVEKYFASVYFQRALISANVSGSIDDARKYGERAVSLGDSDAFRRFLVDVDLARLNQLGSGNQTGVSEETIRANFFSIFGNALDHTNAALNFDETNYENYLTRAKLYEFIVPLKDENAYKNALANYETARGLNPLNPGILLMISRLELTKGDSQRSKDYVIKAIQEKNNYTEAIFFLSQIQANEGNLKDAIISVGAVATLAPNDPGIFFQLGLLRYNNKDYAGAVSALSRAIEILPSYANAKYFLGLSYEKLGRDGDAIKEFTDLQSSNPDSKEVDLILKNLKAGRAPFSSATPPIDDKPEKRSKLPVKEDESKTSTEESE